MRATVMLHSIWNTKKCISQLFAHKGLRNTKNQNGNKAIATPNYHRFNFFIWLPLERATGLEPALRDGLPTGLENQRATLTPRPRHFIVRATKATIATFLHAHGLPCQPAHHRS